MRMPAPNKINPATLGFKNLGKARAEAMQNLATGEIISQRQYRKLLRAKQLGRTLSNELLAKENRLTEPIEAALRPARGKPSFRKLDKSAAKEAAERRIAEEKAVEEKRLRDIEARKKERRIEVAKKKHVHIKKVTARLLKPGHMGARVPFNTYADYEKILREAIQTRRVFMYGLGMTGIFTDTGRISHVTLWSMRALTMKISEEEFNERVTDWLLNRSSMSTFSLMHFWVYLAFDIKYAREKTIQAGGTVDGGGHLHMPSKKNMTAGRLFTNGKKKRKKK